MFAWIYEIYIFKARIYGAIKATSVYKRAHQVCSTRQALKQWKANRKAFCERRWNASLRCAAKQPEVTKKRT